jgi:hypothetical protein
MLGSNTIMDKKERDAVDELVAHSQDGREMRPFHEFHRKHPEVLDLLIEEIHLRFGRGFTAFSYHRLWHYASWKLEMAKEPSDTFLMNDNYALFYARAIAISHPEFDGLARFGNGKSAVVRETRIGVSAREESEEVFVWGRRYGLAAWFAAHESARREVSPCDQAVESQLAAR